MTSLFHSVPTCPIRRVRESFVAPEVTPGQRRRHRRHTREGHGGPLLAFLGGEGGGGHGCSCKDSRTDPEAYTHARMNVYPQTHVRTHTHRLPDVGKQSLLFDCPPFSLITRSFPLCFLLSRMGKRRRRKKNKRNKKRERERRGVRLRGGEGM